MTGEEKRVSDLTEAELYALVMRAVRSVLLLTNAFGNLTNEELQQAAIAEREKRKADGRM